jgi:membrane protein implicated in regulation of membrane protease activity
MWRDFAETLARQIRGEENDDLAFLWWALGSMGLSLLVVVLGGDYALHIIVFGPATGFLLWIVREVRRQQPPRGRYGRVGRLSDDELRQAQNKLLRPPQLRPSRTGELG